MKLDILAIGVHPDDVELGCSGTIINEVNAGKKVGILDLTEGELGTRGTVATRYEEATNAAKILGVSLRENMQFRDGFFVNDETHQLALIKKIRAYQPEVVFSNVLEDRHPDHGRAGQLISDACFLAGLSKIKTVVDYKEQERWRPKYVFQYIQDRLYEPDFIVDISDVYGQRMKAIEAYATQFYSGRNNDDEPQTYISTPDFFESITARARLMGKRIGVRHGEGFLSVKDLGIKNLDAFIMRET